MRTDESRYMVTHLHIRCERIKNEQIRGLTPNDKPQWDYAYDSEGPNPGRSGTFSWTIPGLWKVGDNGPTNSLPSSAKWYQDFILSPNGDFEIRKFGWDVTRYLNGTYVTNHVGP
jgi:hypothetical protein